MAHVGIPLLVILVLCRVSAAPVIDCGSVGIRVEDVDVSKPSAHFDRVVACTTISASPFLAVFLWSRVCANALWPILCASIVVIPICADFDTPENETNLLKQDYKSIDKLNYLFQFSYPEFKGYIMLPSIFYSPLWCVVPEVVEFPLNEQSVQVIKAVWEASNVCQVGCMVGRVLMDIHCPVTSTWVISIPRASHVTLVNSGLGSWMFIHTYASAPFLKARVGKPGCIAKCYAPGMEPYLQSDVWGLCQLSM